ncbi:MAG: polymorphic toxin-type HINT domain-containing protein [Planctomycetaceae bacterium]
MSQKTSISIATATVDRTGHRVLTLLLPIIVAAICLWMAMPHTARTLTGVASSAVAVSSGKGFQPANQSTLQAATVAPTAIPVSLPAASPKLVTRPIEDIRPGMRVLASNPEETETLADSDVTAEDWRLVSLTMTKEQGGTLRVQLLRPIEWLVTEAVILIADADDPQSLFVNVPSIPAAPDTEDDKLQRLLLGQTIHLDLPELGAQGPATVTAIDPCPPLDKPQPGRRMVTGTFRHFAANVVDLQVGSESESFGVTDNHPFWSVDREQFVEAGLLRIGEQLQCADGTITQVTRITPRRGPPVEVYNFEVDAEHVYHVGTTGVLVHNACAPPIMRAAQHGSRSHHNEMVRPALLKVGQSGITNVRTNQALSNGLRTVSTLRPDVQYMKDGLIYVIEINKSGGAGYFQKRLAEIRSALGSAFGGYQQINI